MLKKTITAVGIAALTGAGAMSVLPDAQAATATPQEIIELAAGCNPCNPCAANKCNPCNPCAAKACNPCNPCAAKNPCNPCNPCAAKNPCNPCAAQ